MCIKHQTFKFRRILNVLENQGVQVRNDLMITVFNNVYTLSLRTVLLKLIHGYR